MMTIQPTKYDYVLYIGRFQPIHNGHFNTIKQAFKQTKNLIVILGSSYSSLSPKDPFTTDLRISMIESVVGILKPDFGSNIRFIKMEDRLYKDDKWLGFLQLEINKIVGDGTVAIIGHDKGDSGYIKDCFPKMDFIDTGPYIKENEGRGKVVSATKIRQLMFDGDVGYTESNLPAPVYKMVEEFTETPEFEILREWYDHIIAEEELIKPFSRGITYSTVDSVVVQSGHVLLVKRAEVPGKGLWALPGVHIGLNETADEASLRAIEVETGLHVPVKVLEGSLRQKKTFDHPERSLRARLLSKNARSITTAYHYVLNSEKPLPTQFKTGNGISKAWWYSFAEVKKMRQELFEDHADIIDYFIG
jgi:bifunctional NMN adenylyltransferase/nudix hydrolase